MLSNDMVEAIGRALKAARTAQGLTLREAAIASADRFRPTSIAGYERGERRITVERFCDLCDVYGVAPDRLLAVALRAARGEVEDVDEVVRGTLAVRVDDVEVIEPGGPTDVVRRRSPRGAPPRT